MKNERSYAELMKSHAMNRQKVDKNYVKRLYVEMVITEAILQSEKENLLKQIDCALDIRDEAKFFLLSNQLKDLSKKFGA